MQKRKINEDFDQDKFFDEEDANEPARTNNQDDDEIDPLDAYMQEVGVQLKQDLAKPKKEQVVEYFENEDPIDTQYQDIKKRLLKKHNNKQDPDEVDPEEVEFLDSDGDLDMEQLKQKNKRIEPLAPVDHSKIKYEDFEKNFYVEHEEISSMTQQQVDKIRRDLEIKIKGTMVCRPIISFAHLGFDETLMDKISAQKFVKPTAIQSQALPCAMNGRDLIGVAKTGSGKTVAYVWPMLIHILDQREVERKEGPIAIVILPTRELGQQVYLETKKYASIYGIRVCAIIGGENKRYQWKDLISGMDVVIATPGRLIEMLKKKATNLKRCTYVVLDEADSMFSLGFEYQIRSIIDNIRPDRQTLLFTATMGKKIQQLCVDNLNDPVVIQIGSQDKAVNEDIKQVGVIVEDELGKQQWLLKNLGGFLSRGKVLIFVSQIGQCETLASLIRLKLNEEVLTLHGDKLQFERTTIINAFKSARDILVATDIASRGLDIKEIRTVINYHSPKDADAYIHRIGRTGRAGNQDGVAYSLVQKEEFKFAILLIKNLELVGQVIPPELEQVAMLDDRFRVDRTKKKMGLEYAKGKDASKMLKQALKRQRNSSNKAGLGYQETEEEKKAAELEKKQQKEIRFGGVPQKKIQLQPFAGDVPDANSMKFQNQWQKLNPFQYDYEAYAQSVGIGSVQTREEAVEHYQLTMRQNFLGSFVSGGEYKSKGNKPQVSYVKKDDK